MSNLFGTIKVDQILGYYAAGTTKRTSSIIDMSGWEGVVFVASLGTTIENGTVLVGIEQNTANTTSGMAGVAGTAAHTITAANAALTSSCIVVDVHKPRERYLQCFITPAVQNAVILGIVAIRYNGSEVPDVSGPILATILASPAES